MFEIAWTELVLIAVVAIVVIGPKDLPRAMRIVGQWSGRAKRMAREFQGQFNEALREAELEDVKKDVQALTKFDPLKDVRKELADVDSTVRDIDKPKPLPAALTQSVGATAAASSVAKSSDAAATTPGAAEAADKAAQEAVEAVQPLPLPEGEGEAPARDAETTDAAPEAAVASEAKP